MATVLMMPSADLTAADVLADAAPDAPQQRTITGKILPFRTRGRTSAGLLEVDPAAVLIPERISDVKLLLGHDRDKPIGRAVDIHARPDGLYASFLVGNSADARQAWQDARDGIRDGFSVELDDITINDDGTVTSGALIAVALHPVPAYTDARADQPEQIAAALAESETPDMPEQLAAAEPATVIPAPDAAMRAAAVRTQPVSAVRALADQLRTARFDSGDAGLMAALADITGTGGTAALATDARNELWDGRGYVTKYDVAFRELELKAAKIQGWAWTAPPEVDAYAGDKTAIPSNAATLADVSTSASRVAGGHDIDRIHIDFDSGFLESYWRAMTDSVAEHYDEARISALDTIAGTPGSAVSVGDAYTQALITLGQVDYMIVGSDIAAADLGKPASELPAALTGGTLYGNGSAPDVRIATEITGEVICGIRSAAEFYTERPPIRVEGVNVPNAGVDAAVFGYYAALPVNSARILAYTVTPVL